MSASGIVFYVLATLVLGGAIMAVTARKIFRAAIALLFSLIGVAGLYFWLSYEFIAAVQIVVYVGGIIVLIIFSIFLTQESGADMKRPLVLRAIFSALAVVFGCAMTVFFLLSHSFLPFSQTAVSPDVSSIGRQMLSTTQYGYMLPFEVVSMLLLAAMIGCIVIALKVKTKA